MHNVLYYNEHNEYDINFVLKRLLWAIRRERKCGVISIRLIILFLHMRGWSVGGISELGVTSLCFFGYPLLVLYVSLSAFMLVLFFILVNLSVCLHHYRYNRVEVVQWLLENSTISDIETVNYVLRWASG